MRPIFNGGLLKINSDGDSLFWKLLHYSKPGPWHDNTWANGFYKLSGDSIIFGIVKGTDISCSYRIYLYELQSNSDSVNLCWDIDNNFGCENIIQSKNGNIIVLGTWLGMWWENPLFLISIDKIIYMMM